MCLQVLPLVPPDPEYYSPYSGLDTNCGNPLLIDLAALITEGLLDTTDAPPRMPDGDVQFEKVSVAALVCDQARLNCWLSTISPGRSLLRTGLCVCLSAYLACVKTKASSKQAPCNTVGGSIQLQLLNLNVRCFAACCVCFCCRLLR